LGTVIIMGVLAFSTRASFVAGFNAYFISIGPDLYDRIIQTASISTAFSWHDTMAWMSLLATGYMMAWWFTPMLGEIKSAENFKTMVYTMVLPVVLSTAMFLLFAALYLNTAGQTFLASLGYLMNAGNDIITKMPFQPYFTILPLVLVSDTQVAILLASIMGLALVLSAFFYNVSNFLGPSRYLFSQSFDRILPGGVSYVHPRWHTPLVAIMICAVGGIAWTFFGNAYPQLFLYTSAAILAQQIVSAVVCVVGIVFPFTHAKRIYEVSPVRWKVAGVPVISVVSSVGLVWQLIVMYFFLSVPQLGATGYPPSYYMIAGFFILALLWYFTSKWYRRRQGIDIDLVFAYLPPL